MRLLAVSAHYFPRVGGTVNYVHETLSELVGQGVEVELLVPGPAPDGWQPGGQQPPYGVTWIDAGYPAKGDPGREQRYAFCQKVNEYALKASEADERPDVVHVLFGLFVMEVLDTARLRAAGVPCLATVHNVPPMECRAISHDAPPLARLKEALRLRAVAFKNRTRLKKHNYDLYIVPSEQVAGLLRPIVGDKVVVIGHGLTSDLQVQMAPPANRRPDDLLRLLTVGGYVPHKRQHLIPEIAARLKDAGLDICWEVAGPPSRVAGYFEGIQTDIRARGLDDQVILHTAVPFAELGALYDRANLYVQPSAEEGFCLTALDAAAVGLPVIGSPAGALPAITKASGGALIETAPAPLATAIIDFVKKDHWPDAATQRIKITQAFSWELAAGSLQKNYRNLVSAAGR